MTATAIGSGFRRAGWRLALALLIGPGTVAADLFLVGHQALWLRLAVPAVAIAALWRLAGFDRACLGLVARPRQPLSWWIKIALISGAAVALFWLAASLLLLHLGRIELPGPPMFRHPDHVWQFLWLAVVVAPLVEEPIYRLCLCAPLAPVLGRWPTIAVSGAVFALLHFVYGNPSPENFIGGFVLGWAYLHSGTLWMPIALHALGNLLVWAANALHFHLYDWP